MRMKSCLLILTFAALFTAQAQSVCDSTLRTFCSEKCYDGGLPAAAFPLQTVKHTAYTLGYSEQHEQAAWVCYVLSQNECSGNEGRSSSFYQDKLVTTGSAHDTDYKNSGFDRGHLAPAGDMAYSSTSMTESFFYSNMSPQTPSFNRGIWKKLETQIRDWGTMQDHLLIITGPVLNDSLKTIGGNGVSVPELYYKIVVNPSLTPPQAIGFLLKNEASSQPLTSFVVTIDSIETVSGIDFLPGLSDSCQQLESHVTGTYWKGFETISIAPTATVSVKTPKQNKQKPARSGPRN